MKLAWICCVLLLGTLATANPAEEKKEAQDALVSKAQQSGILSTFLPDPQNSGYMLALPLNDDEPSATSTEATADDDKKDAIPASTPSPSGDDDDDDDSAQPASSEDSSSDDEPVMVVLNEDDDDKDEDEKQEGPQREMAKEVAALQMAEEKKETPAQPQPSIFRRPKIEELRKILGLSAPAVSLKPKPVPTEKPKPLFLNPFNKPKPKWQPPFGGLPFPLPLRRSEDGPRPFGLPDLVQAASALIRRALRDDSSAQDINKDDDDEDDEKSLANVNNEEDDDDDDEPMMLIPTPEDKARRPTAIIRHVPIPIPIPVPRPVYRPRPLPSVTPVAIFMPVAHHIPIIHKPFPPPPPPHPMHPPMFPIAPFPFPFHGAPIIAPLPMHLPPPPPPPPMRRVVATMPRFIPQRPVHPFPPPQIVPLFHPLPPPMPPRMASPMFTHMMPPMAAAARRVPVQAPRPTFMNKLVRPPMPPVHPLLLLVPPTPMPMPMPMPMPVTVPIPQHRPQMPMPIFPGQPRPQEEEKIVYVRPTTQPQERDDDDDEEEVLLIYPGDEQEVAQTVPVSRAPQMVPPKPVFARPPFSPIQALQKMKMLRDLLMAKHAANNAGMPYAPQSRPSRIVEIVQQQLRIFPAPQRQVKPLRGESSEPQAVFVPILEQ